MSKKTPIENSKNCHFIEKMFGLPIFGGSKGEVLKIMTDWLRDGKSLMWVATVNPEFVMVAKRDAKFLKILRQTTINTVDGIGLVWAEETLSRCKIYDSLRLGSGQVRFKTLLVGIREGINVLKGKYRDRVAAGSEMIVDLCKVASEKRWKVFFLGGFGDGAKLTGENVSGLVGGKLIFKSCPGRPEYNDAQVMLAIHKYKPKILFVAYGMKKQEEWIDTYRKELEKAGVRLVMGVGRSFDYYSGKLKMAPSWIKRMGLEWLYSLVKDPKRLKRQMVLPKFIREVLVGGREGF